MKKYTKISFGILLAAIVAGLIAYISYINGTGFLAGLNTGFFIGSIISIILVPTGIIFSLFALAKEEKLLPGIMLSVFFTPVIVILGEPYFEKIRDKIDDNIVERRERTESILSEAYEIMAEKKPLCPLNEPKDGYPVYLLDVALINYNDSIEDGEFLYQIEELYVNATYNKIKKMNKEIPYTICKKRVRFTPSRDIYNNVKSGYYDIDCYDISCTDYLYKDKSYTKSEKREGNETDTGHMYGAGIYINLFTWARNRIGDSEITLIYEDTDSLTRSKP